MTRSTAIQDRVAEAILDAAAGLLAQGGEPPSMNDVAAAAGVARATLYRHFPTREQLLQALTGAVIDSTATRLAQADLDAVPVTEAIARVARMIAADGSKYAASSALGTTPRRRRTPDRDAAPGAAATRHRRRDVPQRPHPRGTRLPARQLLEAAARLAAEHLAGAEKAAALVTSVFLHGTENRKDASAQDRG